LIDIAFDVHFSFLACPAFFVVIVCWRFFFLFCFVFVLFCFFVVLFCFFVVVNGESNCI